MALTFVVKEGYGVHFYRVCNYWRLLQNLRAAKLKNQ